MSYTIRQTTGSVKNTQTATVDNATWNSQVRKDALWEQEVIAGTSPDKIPYSAMPAAYPRTMGNLLINGGFAVAQRGNGPATAPAMVHDGWQSSVGSGAGLTTGVESTAVAPGAVRSLSGNYTGAPTGYVFIFQRIEYFAPLLANYVSFSIQAIGTVVVSPYIYDGVNTYYGANYTLTGSWQTLTVTHAIAAAGTRVECGVYIAQATNGTIYLDNAIAVIGSRPEVFQPQPLALDYLACMRYYQQVPLGIREYANVAGNITSLMVPFHVAMSAVPTATVSTLPGPYGNSNTSGPVIANLTTSTADVSITATAVGDTYALDETITLQCALP